MGVEMIHGDCMDYMRGLPDKAFDLAVSLLYFGVSIAECR